MVGINEVNGAIMPNPKNTGADLPNQSSSSQVAKPTSESVKSKADKAVTERANEYIEGVVEVIPNCDYTDSVVYNFKGLGRVFSGNYYVKKVTHTLGETYNVQLEVTMIESTVTDTSSSNTRVEPVKQDPPKAPEAPKNQIITIQRGDTLWALSRKYGTTVEELAKINNIKNPDLIYAGASLKVPTK